VKGRAGGGEARDSEEAPNSTRVDREALVSRPRFDEEDPETVANGVGGAPEANKALLAGHYKTLKGTGTSRESSRARATATAAQGGANSKQSLEGPGENRYAPSLARVAGG